MTDSFTHLPFEDSRFWEKVEFTAKLDESQVREIRELYAAGGISQSKLGALYGVSQTLVGAIVRRKVWDNVS
jgi:hypothetical protein